MTLKRVGEASGGGANHPADIRWKRIVEALSSDASGATISSIMRTGETRRVKKEGNCMLYRLDGTGLPCRTSHRSLHITWSSGSFCILCKRAFWAFGAWATLPRQHLCEGSYNECNDYVYRSTHGEKALLFI